MQSSSVDKLLGDLLPSILSFFTQSRVRGCLALISKAFLKAARHTRIVHPDGPNDRFLNEILQFSEGQYLYGAGDVVQPDSYTDSGFCCRGCDVREIKVLAYFENAEEGVYFENEVQACIAFEKDSPPDSVKDVSLESNVATLSIDTGFDSTCNISEVLCEIDSVDETHIVVVSKPFRIAAEILGDHVEKAFSCYEELLEALIL